MASDHEGSYARVLRRILDDPDFCRLAAHVRHVWLTLIVCQEMGVLGIATIEERTLERRTGLSADQVANAMRQLERTGVIRRDGAWVWLVNHLRFQPEAGGWARSPRTRKGLQRRICDLPRVSFLAEFVHLYSAQGFDFELPPRLNNVIDKVIDKDSDIQDDSVVSVSVSASVSASEGSAEGSDPPRARKRATKADLAKTGCEDYAEIGGRPVSYSTAQLALFSRLLRAGRTREEWRRVLEAMRDRTVSAAKFARDGDGTRAGGPGITWALRPGERGGFDAILLQIEEREARGGRDPEPQETGLIGRIKETIKIGRQIHEAELRDVREGHDQAQSLLPRDGEPER